MCNVCVCVYVWSFIDYIEVLTHCFVLLVYSFFDVYFVHFFLLTAVIISLLIRYSELSVVMCVGRSHSVCFTVYVDV